MLAMPWFRAAILLAALTISSGYRFRCYIFCTDQTGIQNDYIEQRDQCRKYAELKLDMAMRSVQGPADNKTTKSQLVNLFNECMANNGWNIVQDTKPATPPPPATPEELEARYNEKAALSRSSECMFARYAAANSSIAAARAKACDLECTQRLKSAPDAPRPAACPTDIEPDSNLTRGGQREDEAL